MMPRITVEAIDNMVQSVPFIQECVEVTGRPGQIDWAGSFPMIGNSSSEFGRLGNRQPEDFIEGMTREGPGCTLE